MIGTRLGPYRFRPERRSSKRRPASRLASRRAESHLYADREQH